ncbi:MAG: tripartite tricarboxylate transporter permease [Puniceicoccales bacterium]|jgi:hypothetical protein|nr:tripartite tricarboxylate transporter permease [Puniceicoccales bacterium]
MSDEIPEIAAQSSVPDFLKSRMDKKFSMTSNIVHLAEYDGGIIRPVVEDSILGKSLWVIIWSLAIGLVNGLKCIGCTLVLTGSGGFATLAFFGSLIGTVLIAMAIAVALNHFSVAFGSHEYFAYDGTRDACVEFRFELMKRDIEKLFSIDGIVGSDELNHLCEELTVLNDLRGIAPGECDYVDKSWSALLKKWEIVQGYIASLPKATEFERSEQIEKLKGEIEGIAECFHKLIPQILEYFDREEHTQFASLMAAINRLSTLDNLHEIIEVNSLQNNFKTLLLLAKNYSGCGIRHQALAQIGTALDDYEKCIKSGSNQSKLSEIETFIDNSIKSINETMKYIIEEAKKYKTWVYIGENSPKQYVHISIMESIKDELDKRNVLSPDMVVFFNASAQYSHIANKWLTRKVLTHEYNFKCDEDTILPGDGTDFDELFKEKSEQLLTKMRDSTIKNESIIEETNKFCQWLTDNIPSPNFFLKRRWNEISLT